MNAGSLNEQVTAYAYSTSSDGMGGKRSTVEESFTDWARVVRSGSERVARDARTIKVARYEVTMRSRLDWSGSVDGPDFPNSVFKIVYRGRTLLVDGPPREEEGRMYVVFECTEEV